MIGSKEFVAAEPLYRILYLFASLEAVNSYFPQCLEVTLDPGDISLIDQIETVKIILSVPYAVMNITEQEECKKECASCEQENSLCGDIAEHKREYADNE